MIDAIETITEAIPCNIVYGRKQAAQAIAQALSAAGFTIMSKEDVERIERAILDDREGKVSAATVLHMIKDAMQR